MPQDLSVHVPTIPSLPPWARSFVTMKLSDGQTESRREMTVPERAEIERLCEQSEAALKPASRGEILARAARLLLSFPAQDLSEAAAKFRSEGYLTALSEYPAWAIGQACEAWLRREEPEGNENYAFAPSPPQLARLCRIMTQPARSRLAELQAIRQARPGVVEEMTDEELRRRREKAQRALALLTG